jgi:RimJ/RimL family protein N-acetyltransferase
VNTSSARPDPFATILTKRLRLRAWREDDRAVFAELHADLEVMIDEGGPLDRAASDMKFARYRLSFDQHFIGRWAVETLAGRFLGYAGIMWVGGGHPLGEHVEIGWRFQQHAWGQGYATEAASAALTDAFKRQDMHQVFAYTAKDNVRSRAVISRLGLRRRTALDFTTRYDGMGLWHGQVWTADRETISARPKQLKNSEKLFSPQY